MQPRSSGFSAAPLVLAALWGVSSAHAQSPDWLSGHWLSCAGGRQVSETWTGAGSSVMLGAGLTRGAHGVDFEFMRIAPHEGGSAFFGSPRGAPATAFKLVSATAESLVFENPAHDFPQRITYARAGDVLTARVESTDGKRGMTWRYTRAPHDQACPAG